MGETIITNDVKDVLELNTPFALLIYIYTEQPCYITTPRWQ